MKLGFTRQATPEGCLMTTLTKFATNRAYDDLNPSINNTRVKAKLHRYIGVCLV